MRGLRVYQVAARTDHLVSTETLATNLLPEPVADVDVTGHGHIGVHTDDNQSCIHAPRADDHHLAGRDARNTAEQNPAAAVRSLPRWGQG